MKSLSSYLNLIPVFVFSIPDTDILQQSGNVTANIQAFILVLLAVLILWWRLVSNARQTTQEVSAEYAHHEEHAAVHSDDLTVIEGIGPKIAAILQSAGITTYAQLAHTEAARLEAILDAAGSRYRLANPTTWPEQAALAAAGNWNRLQELQGRLIAGRE